MTRASFILANKYSKTVQIEVKLKVYTDVARPMTERRKKRNLVSETDTGDQRYSCFKKDSVHSSAKDYPIDNCWSRE